MSDREWVLEAVRKMPEQSSLETILDELTCLAELRRRVADADQQQDLLPHDRAVDLVKAWKAKAGK